MSDLVQRLRDSVRAARALDRSALLAEAADEIERLRGGTKPMPEEKRAEVSATNHDARPGANPQPDTAPRQSERGTGSITITDAEREAIAAAIAFFSRGYGTTADTLHGLLERLK